MNLDYYKQKVGKLCILFISILIVNNSIVDYLHKIHWL